MTLPNPHFDALVIGALRQRLVVHNQALTKRDDRLTLGKMKGLYRRFYQGIDDPHLTALVGIDRHLTKLRKAEFDAGDHPRGDGGKFRSKGGARAGAFYPATHDEHEGLKDENVGYRQNQTAIIPETRYETFGPPAATALGVGVGAIHGAFFSTTKGDFIDRSISRGGRFLGRKLGSLAGRAVIGAPVILSAKAARVGIGAINRNAGTRLPRPSPKAGTKAVEIGANIGRRIGGHVGSTAGLPGKFLGSVSWGTRKGVEHLVPGWRGKVAAAALGGAIGGIVPGYYAYGRPLAAGVSSIAPFIDALFPRQVEKAFGADIAALLTNPDVLAKRDAVLGSNDPLEKALGAEIVRRAVRLIGTKARGVVTSNVGTVPRKFRMSAAGRVAVTAGGGAVGSVVGAAGGAAIGAGRALWSEFNDKHPRDQRGRFSHANSGRSIAHAAVVGAVVGSGIGLLGGRYAARRFETKLARDALATHFSADNVQRIHADLAAKVKDRIADRFLDGMHEADKMHADVLAATAKTKAEKTAAGEFGRAASHLARHRPSLPETIPVAPGGDMHATVRGSIARAARTRFDNTVGRAATSPVNWITHQLDEGFDAEFRKGMGALGEKIPTFANAKGAKTNLINNVDPDELSPDARKLWDGLAARRTKTLDEVKGALERRGGDMQSAQKTQRDLQRKVQGLATKRQHVQYRGAELIDGDDVEPAELRAFLKSEFDIESTVGKRLPRDAQIKALKTELHSAITKFDASAKTEIEDMGHDLDDAKDQVNHLSADLQGDLRPAEREAIRNPFAKGKAPFFEPMPTREELDLMRQVAVKRDPTVRAFDTVTEHRITSAGKRLARMLATQKQALERRARSGITDAGARWMRRVTPMLAQHIDDAMADLHALRETMMGNRQPKGFLHWVLFDRNMKTAGDWMNGQAKRAHEFSAKVGSAAWNNKAKIVSALGVAEAIGGVSYDDKTGTRVTLNPLKWSLPRALKVEASNPDPFNKDKGLVGVTYRARDGKRRFLVGAYDDGQPVGEGKPRPRRDIAFNADLEQVRERVRQGGAQGGQGGAGGGAPGPVLPDDKRQEAITAVATLRGSGKISEGGSGDWTYQHKEGPDHGRLQNEVRDAFIAAHNKRWQFKKEQRPNNPGAYFGAMRSLFETPETALLSQQNRADILTGKGLNHGILAWDPAYDGSNKGQIKQALMREFAGQGQDVHVPRGDSDRKQVFRAIHVLAAHYGLDGSDAGQIQAMVEKRMAGQPVRDGRQEGQVERRAEPPRAASQTRIDPSNLATELWNDGHHGGHTDKAGFHAMVGRAYQIKLDDLKRQGKEGRAAEVEALNSIEAKFKGYQKSDYAVDLRKAALWGDEAGSLFGGSTQRVAGTAAGDLGEAAGRSLGGAGDTGTREGEKSDRRSFFEPTRIAGAAGSLAGGSAGWEGASHYLKTRAASRATAASGRAASRKVGGLGVPAGEADEAVASRLTGAGLKSLAAEGAGHVVGLGLKLAGSTLGGMAAQVGLEAAARAGYRAFGKKPPAAFAPKQSSGEFWSRQAGSIVGQGIGGILGAEGGPVGSIAAGTALGVAGDGVGGWLYHHFASNYGGATAKHMGRYFTQAKRA